MTQKPKLFRKLALKKNLMTFPIYADEQPFRKHKQTGHAQMGLRCGSTPSFLPILRPFISVRPGRQKFDVA